MPFFVYRSTYFFAIMKVHECTSPSFFVTFGRNTAEKTALYVNYTI